MTAKTAVCRGVK